MFMLQHGTDHEKCTPPYGRSEKVSAAADRQPRPRPRQVEISMHSHSLQSSSIAMTINMLNKSILDADYDDAVFMDG